MKPPCGTVKAYLRHVRRNEIVDTECALAHALEVREYRARKVSSELRPYRDQASRNDLMAMLASMNTDLARMGATVLVHTGSARALSDAQLARVVERTAKALDQVVAVSMEQS